MKVVATIEARMTSTRLPGKVLLPLAGEPMLVRLLERLRRVQRAQRIVIATTSFCGSCAKAGAKNLNCAGKF